jgi:hypothetical protein
MDWVDGPDAYNTEWIKLEFFMGPENPALDSKYSRHFSKLKDGYPEDLIKWLKAFRELEYLMPLKEPADKTRIFQTLLKGQALCYF